MSTTIDAPLEWVETVSSLRLPPKADQRLQELMDRNNEGLLTETERADLESLVDSVSGYRWCVPKHSLTWAQTQMTSWSEIGREVEQCAAGRCE